MKSRKVRQSTSEIPDELLRQISAPEEWEGELQHGLSKVGRLPWGRDPMVQLALGTATVLAAILGGLIAAEPWRAALGAVAIGAAFLTTIVLMRSVRHGWNLQSYGWARRATRRAATYRLENEALWRAAEDLAALTKNDCGADDGEELLRALFTETQRAMVHSQRNLSLVLAEEAAGRFFVICAAGRIRKKPYYVAPRKSCIADRAFPVLLQTFAPAGSSAARRVQLEERTCWIGLTSTDSEIAGAERVMRGLESWVVIVAELQRLPVSVERVELGNAELG